MKKLFPFEADADFTPETFADGKKLVNSLEGQGVKVIDQGPRWEAPELDVVVWKPYPQEQVGSSAKDAFTRQKAMPGSDAYANDGAMFEVSNGKYGVKDELGAAMANVKKGLDARADAAAGRGDPKINMKEELKSAWKAAEYTGTKMDPELKTMAENLKTYQTLDEAGVYNLGDKPEVQAKKVAQVQERVDQSWKESLETGTRKSARRAAIREQLAEQALQAGDRATYTSLREKAINARASNEVTMQAMAEDYPVAVKKLTGVDPSTPAGKEELLGGKSRVARELMTGAREPLPGEGVAPLIDRFKGLGRDTLRTAGEIFDTALPARARSFGGKALTGMFGAGIVSAGYIAERDASIAEGRRATPHGAALEVLKGFTATPFQHAKEITEGEILKSDAAKESRWWAAWRALGEVGAEMSGHNMSRGILHEELLKEAERARELGREPHEWAGKVRAGIRVAGEHGWGESENAGTESENAGTGSGWTRKGDLRTLSANPEGDVPIFDPGAGGDRGFDPGPAATGGPEAGQLIQSAEAAAARCDFRTVHSVAGNLSTYYPGHPWLSGRYQQIQGDESSYQAAQSSLSQARSVLERPEPTNGDIQQAAQIALQAQSIAPSCMSQQVSLLNGPIYQAQGAVRARDRANRRAGMQSLLGALVSVQSSINSGRAATGYQPSYSAGSGLDTLTSVISQATGGGTIPSGGALPSGGASPGGSVSSGGGGAASNCNSCIIGTFSFGNAYSYVFETSYSFSNQGGCTSGRARIYEVMSFPPDEDANGNPLRHANKSAARYLQAKRTYGRGAQTRKVCGPCGSAAQARSTVSRLCPRPAHSISGGPGGAVVDGRRVSPR